MDACDGVVRAATETDLGALAELWLRSRRATSLIPPPVHSDDEVRAWFRDEVVPSGDAWVATRATTLVAMMVLEADWVEQLYVDPARVRQGYGSLLLRFAQSSRSELALWTFEANTPARAFYERHGFRVRGQASCDNEEGHPALRYCWKREGHCEAASGRAVRTGQADGRLRPESHG